jgi:choline kinase
MKVIILAAGISKRIAPYIGNRNKTLIDVSGQTVLGRMVKAYSNHGLNDFLVVTGHDSNAVISEMNSLSKALPINFREVFNPKDDEMNNCYSLLLAVNGVREDILVSNKDIVFDQRLLQNVLKFRDENFMVIDNIMKLSDEDMKVYVKDGRITDISKHLDVGKSYGEYMGISVVRERSLPALKRSLEKIVKESPNLYYEDGYRLMLGEDQFYVLDTGKFKWSEIDTLEDVARAQEVTRSSGELT